MQRRLLIGVALPVDGGYTALDTHQPHSHNGCGSHVMTNRFLIPRRPPATGPAAHPGGHAGPSQRAARPQAALAAALLGFFVVTLDALVVNVALPVIRTDLGGGITGLQWMIDAYTLVFAALLLTAGFLSDRIGPRRAFGLGLLVFVAASAACGLAPTLAVLIVARLVQGAGAAAMMPTSLALIRVAYTDRWRSSVEASGCAIRVS